MMHTSRALSITLVALLLSAACSKKADPAPAQPADPPAAPTVKETTPAAEAPTAPEQPADKPADALPGASATKIKHIRAAHVRDGALYVELRLDEAQSKALEAAPDEQIDADLPLTTALLPEMAREATRYIVITEAGPVTTEPARAARIERGGLIHLYHITPLPAGVSADGQLVAIVSDAPPSGAAKRRAFVGEDVTAPAMEPIIKLVRERIAASKEDPTAAQRFSPADHVQIMRGSFGQGRTLVVAYAVPFPQDMEAEQSLSHTSGLFFADGLGASILDGKVDAPQAKIELESLVDLEGDGVEEVVYGLGYYEAYYHQVLELTADGPHHTEIAGDGA